jgi:endonuclease/exonuclease/phosphatase family metal-dependent hydrolase
MNLCLSGIGDCAPGSDPASAVAEAVDQVRRTRADLVVLKEACSGDAERIASTTRLHVTFSVVRYRGTALACSNPGGRGVFGNAVLTTDRPQSVRDVAYRVQDPLEERRALCVETRHVAACGTHLEIRGLGLADVNDAQCRELAGVLRKTSRGRPTVGSGDMNRRDPCAPPGWWAESDRDAGQRPGLLQAYGDHRLTDRSVEVLPMSETDHDALVVRFTASPGG